MHFTCTVYCCVFYNSQLAIWTQNTIQRWPVQKITFFLKTRCRIACSRDWLNCGSLAAAVQPSTISDHPCYLSGCDIKFQNWNYLALKKEEKLKVLSDMLPTQHCYLEGTQASPVCPTGKRNMYMKSMEHGWHDTNRVKQNYAQKPLSTTKLTRTGLGYNQGLHPEKASNNRLSHGTVCTGHVKMDCIKILFVPHSKHSVKLLKAVQEK
jgi:hypothetical protein